LTKHDTSMAGNTLEFIATRCKFFPIYGTRRAMIVAAGRGTTFKFRDCIGAEGFMIDTYITAGSPALGVRIESHAHYPSDILSSGAVNWATSDANGVREPSKLAWQP